MSFIPWNVALRQVWLELLCLELRKLWATIWQYIMGHHRRCITACHCSLTFDTIPVTAIWAEACADTALPCRWPSDASFPSGFSSSRPFPPIEDNENMAADVVYIENFATELEWRLLQPRLCSWYISQSPPTNDPVHSRKMWGMTSSKIVPCQLPYTEKIYGFCSRSLAFSFLRQSRESFVSNRGQIVCACICIPQIQCSRASSTWKMVASTNTSNQRKLLVENVN